MNNPSINPSRIQAWMQNHLPAEAATVQLQAEGFDENTIELYLKEFKKQQYAKRQLTGFLLIGIGAFLGFISCLATMTDLIPEWRNFFLYGLSFVGVSLVCWGMYYVFED
jgi:hypothetical protein